MIVQDRTHDERKGFENGVGQIEASVSDLEQLERLTIRAKY